MSLEALICKQCGGQIDRTTLVCPHCNTAYKMSYDRVLIHRQLEPNEVVLGAHVSFDPRYLRYDGQRAIEYETENLTYQLAQQLLPFMEVETKVDLDRAMLELYGRLRVLKSNGNLFEVYDKIAKVETLHDAKRIADKISL